MTREKFHAENLQREAELGAPPTSLCSDTRRTSLCDLLDRILEKGAVVVGEVTISVADVDLLHLKLRLVLAPLRGHASTGCGSP